MGLYIYGGSVLQHVLYELSRKELYGIDELNMKLLFI